MDQELRGPECETSIWSKCRGVERNPAKVSRAWVFRGTRVPVSALLANLRAGATVPDFLEWFPGVDREQVDEVLKAFEDTVVYGVHS